MTRKPENEETDFSAPEKLNAADWVALIESDQVEKADLHAFERWSGAKHNAQEYLAHEKLWASLGNLANNAEARAILHRPRQPALPRRQVFGGAALVTAMAAAVAIAVIVATGSFDRTQEFRTVRGELRTVTLEDGSRVTLNTDTELSVVFKRGERRVQVAQGQTFIQVAKDPARTFKVIVQDTEVRALGTAFDVYTDGTSVQVSMAEGTAAVYDANEDSDSTGATPVAVISAGQQLIAAAMVPVRVVKMDARGAGAWRENRVVFERTPLADAVRDVNRYRGAPIVIGNPDIASMTISGTYRIDRLDGFVEALLGTLPIQIQHEDENGIVLGLK